MARNVFKLNGSVPNKPFVPNEQAASIPLDAIPDCIFRVSRSGRVLGYKPDINTPVFSLPADIVGKSIYSVFPKEIFNTIEGAIAAALESSEVQLFECPFVRQNKSSYLEVRTSKVDEEDVLIIIREVSERRRSEECDLSLLKIAKMVQEEKPLEEILSFSCEHIMRLFAVPLLWVGRKEPKAAIKLYTCKGATEELLPGLHLRWSDSLEGNGLTGTAIRTGKLQLMHIDDPRVSFWRDKLTKYKVTSGAAFPLRVGGQVLGALTLWVDDLDFWNKRTIIHLTSFAEQIALALSVSASRQKLSLLTAGLKSSVNAVCISDRNGIIQWVNPAFQTLNGYQPSEAIGKHTRMLWSAHHSLSFYKSIARITSRGRSWQGEMLIRRNDGSEYVSETSITPARDEQGKICNMIMVIQDITERKQAESQQIEAREIVSRAERLSAMGIMAAGIAHEINQPLNSLKVMADGMLYWYKQGRIPAIEEAMTTIKEISHEADRIDGIIKHMRAFIHGDEFTKPTPCSFNEAVDGALSFLGIQLAAHGVEVKTELQEDLPAVLGNSIQLEQIVINLVVNAMQALDQLAKSDKRIAVSTRYYREKVILTVSDNGPGISQDIAGKIFDPFFTTKAAGQGMGLGLSIVHSIVTSYGGCIKADSDRPGEGAVFEVELPITFAGKETGHSEYFACR